MTNALLCEIIPIETVEKGSNIMTNEERAEQARMTLQYFRSIAANDDEVETLAIDLLADMLHLLEQEGVDYERVLRSAENHWRGERPSIL